MEGWVGSFVVGALPRVNTACGATQSALAHGTTQSTSFYICRSKAKIANSRYLRKETEAVKDKDY